MGSTQKATNIITTTALSGTNSVSVGGTYSTSSGNWISGNSRSIAIGSGVTYSNGLTYSSSYETYDFESTCLDIEKLEDMSESKKDMIFKLFLKFVDTSTTQEKTLLYNTLESYSVLVEKKALDRKIKIKAVLSDSVSEGEDET